MTGMMITAALLVGLSLSDPTEVFDRSEDLWMAQRFTDSTALLESVLSSDPGNAGALWRICRNYYDIAENLPLDAKAEKIGLYISVETYARRCLTTHPRDGNCLFWTGVGMGRQGTVQGILSQIRHAKEIRDLWEKAITYATPYRSRDGTANNPGDYYLALGIYYRIVPDWWIVQVLLGTRGDVGKSVSYLKKAIDLEPDRMEYLKEYGASLLCRGQKDKRPSDVEEAKRYLARVQEIPIRKDYDRIDRVHARLLIEHPEMACGYSRDGQQEVTYEEADKAFKKTYPDR